MEPSAHPYHNSTNADSTNSVLGIAPRRSIRGRAHAWDADRAPVIEIQRIRKKTRELRKKRTDACDSSSSITSHWSAASNNSGNSYLSAMDLQRQLFRGVKHRVDESMSTAGMDSGSSSSSSDSSFGENNPQNLALHDLCGEASSPSDIAWRNAVFLLSTRPLLATVLDPSQKWTPLHICCLGTSPTPTFMLHALLYVNPAAASIPDDAGRLPLHLVAASSGDCTSMQLLLQEYPQAIHHVDDHGLTPLLVLLRNQSVQVTLRHVQVLMGMTTLSSSDEDEQQLGVSTKGKHVLQRRQEHLGLSVQSVQEWLSQRRKPPVTNFLNHAAVSHEAFFETSPHDVQVSLRKLAEWKQKQQEAIEVKHHVVVEEGVETNPAAIATFNQQYPIHLLVQRAIIDPAPLRVAESLLDEKKLDDDDVDEDVSPTPKQPSVVEATSILRLLAASCPEVLMTRDVDGLTPLLQVIVEEDVADMEDIAEILLGPPTHSAAWAFDLPLHDDAPHNPAMVPLQETGQLPLHLVAEEHSSKVSLLRSLHRAYPGASLVKDNCGRTPLHLALRAFRREPLDARVVEVLYTDHIANTADDFGQTPADLLLQTRIPHQRPNTRTSKSALAVYQRMFAASTVMDVRKLRQLPPWLRAQACGASIVQEKLVDDMAQQWKCALILLDGLLLVALITLFRMQMKEYVDFINDDGDPMAAWFTYGVYTTAVLRLFGNLLLAGVATSLGELQHLCLYNIWYWTDVVAIVLSIVISVSLYGDSDEGKLLSMATASTCFLWLSLLGYISNWWHGMAIFVGGLSRIAGRLVCPLICGGMLFIAFSQSFYTLLQLDCSEASVGGEAPVCDERDAHRIVYRLVRGDSAFPTDGAARLSDDAVFLSAALVALLATFVIALLVTILVSSKHFQFEGIALEAYWERKLAFVLSPADFGFDARRYASHPDTRFSTRPLARTWSRLWKVLMLEPLDEEDNKEGQSFSFFSSLIIAPLWIIAGVFTLGVLWPPQIRRWLFRPMTSPNEGTQVVTTNTNDDRNQTTQLLVLRKELAQVKLMSFEKSKRVEDELQELKQLLVSALRDRHSLSP